MFLVLLDIYLSHLQHPSVFRFLYFVISPKCLEWLACSGVESRPWGQLASVYVSVPPCRYWHVTLGRWSISLVVGNFPVLALRVQCCRKPLVPGKPWRLVTLNLTKIVQAFSPSFSLHEMVIIIVSAPTGVQGGVNEIIHGKCFGQLMLNAQRTLISPLLLPTLL